MGAGRRARARCSSRPGARIRGRWSSAGAELRELGEEVVVKLVASRAGAAACAALAADGVPTLLTAVYNPAQAVVAAAAGATYIAPYLGKLRGGRAGRGRRRSAPCRSVLRATGSPTKILLASIRDVRSVVELARRGVDRFTHGARRRRAALRRGADRRGRPDVRGRRAGDHAVSATAAVALAVPELVDRARRLAEPGARRILGITGAPGAGKSTLARTVVDELGPQRSILVPMDGFHLSNATLRACGRRDRKGAWDTFDAERIRVHLLRRLREAAGRPRSCTPPTSTGGPRRVDRLREARAPRRAPRRHRGATYLLSAEGSWPKRSRR